MLHARYSQLTQTHALSMPAVLLRLEGLAALLASIVLYASRGENGWVFALLLFVPDLSALAYQVDVRTGSIAYNAVHTYVLPLALGVIALLAGWSPGVQIALIWTAHIGMDRTMGFGLKYPTEFKDTHLGRV